MKGTIGLLLALALGAVGAMFNFVFLTKKSQDMEMIQYIAVKPDVTITRGEKLEAGNLLSVGIPKAWAKNIDKFAVRYADQQTVLGQAVSRTLSDGSLLLEQDLRTPPAELKIEENERVIWIPVDTRSFVPSLVEPGDHVSFLVSSMMPRMAMSPDFAGPDDLGEPIPEAPSPIMSGSMQMVGPFEILAMGNRLGSHEVFGAAKIPQMQENVMAIRVRMEGEQLPANVQKLMNLLVGTSFRPVSIVLHPRKSDDES